MTINHANAQGRFALSLALIAWIIASGCTSSIKSVDPVPILQKLFQAPLPASLRIQAHKTIEGGLAPSVAMIVIELDHADLGVMLKRSGALPYKRKQLIEPFDNELYSWLVTKMKEKKPIWEYPSVYRIESILHPPKQKDYKSVPDSVESFLVVNRFKNGRCRIFIHASPFLANRNLY